VKTRPHDVFAFMKTDDQFAGQQRKRAAGRPAKGSSPSSASGLISRDHTPLAWLGPGELSAR